MLTQLSRTTCIGAFFALQMGGSAPAWILGDTFLVHGSVILMVPLPLIFHALRKMCTLFSVLTLLRLGLPSCLLPRIRSLSKGTHFLLPL